MRVRPLIQAQNSYRIAKNNLCNLLGYNLPREVWDNIPLSLTDTLDAAPYQINLSDAMQQALANRPELVALRKTEELQKLNITNAKSGYKPNLQVFAGYNWYQRAIYAAGRTQSRYQRLERRRPGELGYF